MATTLATLLIKLGFDISDLAAGGAQARGTLNGVAEAAGNVTRMAAPAAAALNNMNRAIGAVEGSRGATNSARSLADAAASVATNTTNSATAMNAFARGASAVASATGSGQALNAYARAVDAIALATKDPKAVADFATRAANGAALMGNQANGVQKLVNSFERAAASAPAMASTMSGAANAASATGAAAEKAAVGANAAAAGMDKASGAALRAGASFNTASKEMDMAANRGSFLNRVLSMAFAFGGGVAVTTVFGFIANAVAGFNSRLEQAHIAFNTLTSDGDAFIQKMLRFADITPFNFSGLEDAAQRLLAMGFASDQILPVLTAVGDAVSALGGTKETLDRVTLALGQMLTAGRVNAQDMRQLTEAGIPAWDILAKAIGKTVAETRKMAETGKISAPAAVEDLVKGMEERFRGLMAMQARTAAGAFSTIQDAMLRTISEGAKPLFDAISKGMVALADFLVNGGGRMIVPAIQAIGVAISAFLIPRLIGLIGTISQATISLGALGRLPIAQSLIGLTVILSAWQENFAGIRDALQPVVDGFLNVARSALAFAASLGVLTPIVAGLVTLWTVRFIASLVVGPALLLANAAASFALAGAFTGLTLDAGAATVAVTGVGVAANVALGPLAILIAALGFLVVAAQQADKSLMEYASTHDLTDKQLADMAHHTNQTVDELKAHIEAYKTAQAAAAGGGTGDIAANFRAEMDKALADFKLTDDQFQAAGAEAMTAVADGIRNAQQAPVDALVALREAMKTQLSPMSEIAQLVGILTSGEIENGINSGIPGAVKAAEALRAGVVERLDALTANAYSAGEKLRAFLAEFGTGPLEMRLEFQRDKLEAAANDWNNKFKPSVDASTAAMARLNKQLEDAGNSQAASQLSSAFNDIRQSAHSFFEEVHRNNLQLIDDALKHKNAIIDAKEALNQAPVTAAQQALDFQRRQIEEWRLRQAIATAQSPEEYRDAVLALQDFLAQAHIDDMQQQVDAANAILETKKKSNQDKAEADRDAENERYRLQVAAFDRDLALLEKSLLDQKTTWQKGQGQILSLLASYGVSFGSVGKALGGTFVANLKDQIDLAIAALKTMSTGLGASGQAGNAGLGQYAGSGGQMGGTGIGTMPSGGGAQPIGGFPQYQTGLWEAMQNHVAFLDKGEMVVPPNLALALRRSFGPGAGSSGFAKSIGSMPMGSGNQSARPIVLKVGEEVFGEIADSRMASQDDVYGSHSIGMSSQR